MKILSTILVLSTAILANAAETKTTDTAAALPATPKATCEALVAAAQQSNFEAFANLSLMGGPGMKMKHMKMAGHNPKMKGAFEKMHKDQLEKLKNLTCGTEHIADTRAFVETTSEGKMRYVPFVKEDTGWKFDTHTYMSFYDAGMKGKRKK
ncbi:MAG: hypothetical protein ABL927_13475 [Bdellovibrionales bacterium]